MKLTREPAAWGALAIALVSLLATWPNPVVSGDQVPLIVAVVDGVVLLVVAVKTRPIAPAVIVGVITPIGALLAGYGIDLPPALIGTLNTIVVPAILGLLVRASVTPTADPAPTTPGDGPVR